MYTAFGTGWLCCTKNMCVGTNEQYRASVLLRTFCARWFRYISSLAYHIKVSVWYAMVRIVTYNPAITQGEVGLL